MAEDTKANVLPPENGELPPGWTWAPGHSPGTHPHGELEGDIGQSEAHVAGLVSDTRAWNAKEDQSFTQVLRQIEELNNRLAALDANLDAQAVQDVAEGRRIRDPYRNENERRRDQMLEDTVRRRDDRDAEATRYRDQTFMQFLQQQAQVNAQVLQNMQQFGNASYQAALDSIDSARSYRVSTNTIAAELADEFGNKMENALNRMAQQQEVAMQQILSSMGAMYGTMPPPGTSVRDPIRPTPEEGA